MQNQSSIAPDDLLVGTNYHPHDWDPERWETDFRLMKQASFTVVRLGVLCWDCFEPRKGQFTFDWFDRVMGLCQKYSLKVVLDLPTRPAPTWLHKMFPEIDITSAGGQRVDAHTRYMEDVGHPKFQKYALRLARVIVQRYKDHPALLAFALCNELGAGYVSYSQAARRRFIRWLRARYRTVEALNAAWNTQRWCRKLSRFDDVVLPVSTIGTVPPERYLDMKRFYSDEIIAYFTRLQQTVRRFAPHCATSSNHWAENDKVGFDYLGSYRQFVDYPGVGFYPGINPEFKKGVIGACFVAEHRIGELDKPMWCLEFQTGTEGGYGPPVGALRMYLYLELLYRSQVFCAWTWRSMLGGEEQYIFGLLDHDGVVSRKYAEYQRVAEEFGTLQKYGFPRRVEPEVAIAFSFESKLVADRNPDYYKTAYLDQVLATYEPLFDDNVDCNFVNLRDLRKGYRLIFVPGHSLMDEASALTLRKFIEGGGTVVMTAYSAKVDETNTCFDTALPGRLAEVFGVTVRGFDRTRTHVPTTNEGGIAKVNLDITRQQVGISLGGQPVEGYLADYYEHLEPGTAQVLGSLTGISGEAPAITSNHFGLGTAIYLAVPADRALISALLTRFYAGGLIRRGPLTPRGVVARAVGEKSVLYVNTTDRDQTIGLNGPVHGVLCKEGFTSTLKVGGYGVELVEPL